MRLAGKTRAELSTLLAGKSQAELVELIFRLVTFEPLLGAREIAEASHVSRNEVLEEMKQGRFIDPIFGAGFFCRAHALRVTTSAANAWRRGFFVSAGSAARAIPSNKNAPPDPPGIGVESEKAQQKARSVGIAGNSSDVEPERLERRTSHAH